MPGFNKFTEKEKDFIRENFADMTLTELAENLGRSVGGVKTWTLKLGLRRNTRFNWTDERIQILTEMYPNNSARKIAEILNTDDYVVYKKAGNLGLKKDPCYLKQLNKKLGKNLQKNGFGHRFKKGHKPWCKGKKIGSKGRSSETQFKKGEKPHNTCNVGDLRKPSGYWKIKVAEPNVWEELHFHLWRKKHGKIPKGRCIVFKDNNPDNCVIENLEMITRKELALRKSIHNLPPEIVEVKQLLGRLTREINKKEGKNNAKK